MARPSKTGPVTTERLLSHWQKAWESGDMTAQFSPAIEKALNKQGFGCWDIRTRIGLIIKKKNPDKHEEALLMFNERTKFMAEVSLADKVANAPAGQIFLLKSKHGYRDQAIDVSIKPVEAVMEYGQS